MLGHLTGRTLSTHTLKRMEMLVLSALDWRVTLITPSHILDKFLKEHANLRAPGCLKEDDLHLLEKRLRKLADLCTLGKDCFLVELP